MRPRAPSRSARSTSRTSARATSSSPASTMPASSLVAETEADIIVWDGGNNDFPFVRPDLHIVLVDPLRPGHETTHHPGEAVLRMADIVVVAKTNSASEADIRAVTETARSLAPNAPVVRAASIVTLDDPAARSPASAFSSSRMAPPSRMAAWPTARAMSRRARLQVSGDRRSQAVRGRRHRRGVPPLPAYRQGAARHGVFGEGARRAAGNHQRIERRRRDRRHAERSGASHAARQAGHSRALRVRRGGRAALEQAHRGLPRTPRHSRARGSA